MNKFNIGDKVVVTAVGTVKSIEELYNGNVKYEVFDTNSFTHCFVFEPNMIKEEDRVVTYEDFEQSQ